MFLPKMTGTSAVQSQGSVSVSVQQENDSFEGYGNRVLSTRLIRTWRSSSVPRLSIAMYRVHR